jgi:hypothetical protein
MAMTFASLALSTLTVSLTMIMLGWTLDRTMKRTRVARAGGSRPEFTGARRSGPHRAEVSATVLR